MLYVLSSPKDVPGAMSSWSAVISLGDQFDRHVVLCTGEEAELQTRSGGHTRHHFCHRSFPVPMSTFAIAIGAWEVRSIETGHPVTRIIGEGYRSDKRIQKISVLPHPHYSPSDELRLFLLTPSPTLSGPRNILEKNYGAVSKYIPSCLIAAQSLLGEYPLPRLDIVIIHRSFSGLGLASPHLLFLSPR